MLMKQAFDAYRGIRNYFFTATLAVLALASGEVQAQTESPKPINFNRDIRPILSENCFACHGPDEQHREGGLRLDNSDGIASQIESGNADESNLFHRLIEEDNTLVMPPPSTNKVLKPEQIALVKQWINEGGKFEAHWSFVTPKKPAVPEIKTALSNPIDLFLSVALKNKGLGFSPQADKRTLIRRVAFTLTGLPPTPDEVRQFLADESPNAYESMVDRYLASEFYGEEMARHWLDLARYGDTHGLHLDNERQMWAYRDWVVKSFNSDQRFDQFTIEQLAGDLLEKPTREQMIATGFNRCNVTTSEGGAINEEFQFRYAVDRSSTAVQIWTGLTAECAVCHDHKFDPISAKEFYSLYAFFNSAADPVMDGNALLTNPVMSLATEEQQKKIAEYDAQIADLKTTIEKLAADYAYTDPASMDPPPASQHVNRILVDDEFPKFGRLSDSGIRGEFVASVADGKPFSGEKALRRSQKGLGQDVLEEASETIIVPQGGQIFVEVWIDPNDIPKTIMLQFFKEGWNHRAAWGDIEAIEWGAINTTERHRVGDLPKAGEWVHLTVPVDKVGLKTGDVIKGFALTQFDGTVHWDKFGIEGETDPAKDPGRSFLAWWKAGSAQPPEGLPEPLKKIIKKEPPTPLKGEASSSAADSDKTETQVSADSETTQAKANVKGDRKKKKKSEPSEDEIRQLRNYWIQYHFLDARPSFEEKNKEFERMTNELNSFRGAIPQTFVFKDIANPRKTFVMKRGQYDAPGEEVKPDVPAILPKLKPANPERPNRLDFARWLVDEEHPLTSRVIVNRFWQQIFGTGLVKTSGDFGSQGESPSHPELLDFLAVNFRESGWHVKGLLKLLVTSEAFKQSSRVDANLLELDPENRLLARGPRIRLAAEQIRDNVLFTSGLIQFEMGGRGVRTYQPPNVWEPVGYIDSNTRNYKQDSGAALYRRSIYTFYKRTAPPPFMANFDAPNREQICTKRERSNTPLQALQLMNDVQYIEAARAMASRLMKEVAGDDAARIQKAFEVVLSRPARDEEVDILQKQLVLHQNRYRGNVEDAKKLIAMGETKPPEDLDAVDLASWTMVVNTLLNLDEAVNRN